MAVVARSTKAATLRRSEVAAWYGVSLARKRVGAVDDDVEFANCCLIGLVAREILLENVPKVLLELIHDFAVVDELLEEVRLPGRGVACISSGHCEKRDVF